VLIRLQRLERLEALHGLLQLADQLVLLAQAEGRRLLPHLQLGDAPREGAQLRADVRGTRGPEFSLQLDQGLRLGLQFVALLPMGPRLRGEGRAPVLQRSEPDADLALTT